MLRWHDEFRIGFCIDRIIWLQIGRGVRLRVADKHVTRVSDQDTQPVWRAALDALAAMLRKRAGRRAQARVVLSNRLVRYAVIPWHAALMSRAERLAQARHYFRDIYGDVSEDWAIMIDDAGYQEPTLATAIDKGVLQGLRQEFDTVGIRLRSVTPYLCVACNRFRRSLTTPSSDTTLFSVIEPDDICTLKVKAGRPDRILHQRLQTDWGQDLRGQFLQAQCEEKGGSIASVNVLAPEASTREVPSLGVKISVLRLPAAIGYCPQGDPEATMALMGA